MSDRPRDQEPDAAGTASGSTRPPLSDPADAPVTGPPGGASTAGASRPGASGVASGGATPAGAGRLSLEQRLNRLVPPGAAGSPAARAVAVRDENAAVRIYIDELRDRRDQDGWRQLLDARTAYAEALDVQVKSKTPAFYVPPRAADGAAVSDQLIGRSAAACAGAVRRLAVPDL